MIKAKGTVGGRDVVFFGLSHANLDRLRADGLDGGIRIEGKKLGLSADIIITAAETEADIINGMRESFSEDTIVHLSEKLKS